MKFTILMGSPRKDGNTNAILTPFMEELHALGHETELFWLYDLDLRPCVACRGCQKNWEEPACVIQDDMQPIFQSLLTSDAIVLASPIYFFFCTGPMKNALDRLAYPFTKIYGEEVGPSLWNDQHVSIITTCGIRPELGADLFEEGVKRICNARKLVYDGMLAERHKGYKFPFMDEDKAERARAFARELSQKLG